jgi:hypothetical protein
MVNGSPAGSNSPTYSTTALVNGEMVYCIVTSSETCATGSPANSDSVYFTVYAIPAADAGAHQTTCSNEAVSLTATGGTSYQWSNGDNNATTSVNPSVSATYTVTVFENGCSATDTVGVTVLAAPAISLGGDTTICSYTSLTLDAGSGFVSYLWSDGSTNQTLTVDSVSSGIGTMPYSVTVTGNNACEDADTIIITIQSCAGMPETNNDISISIYPNPASETFNISITGLTDRDIRISITNMLGQLTYNENLHNEAGRFFRQVCLNGYAKGVYYINIYTAERIHTNKIVVD